MYAMDCSFAVRAYAGRWQHGQWVSRLLNAIAIRTRIVAIECGTWRCVLTGRAAWSEIVGYCRLRESHTPPSGGGKTSRPGDFTRAPPKTVRETLVSYGSRHPSAAPEGGDVYTHREVHPIAG